MIPNRAASLTVGLFPGCLTDRLYPEQGEAIVTVLRALGVTVVFPRGLNCCGLPANNSGDDNHARSMARQTIRALERIDVDYIVSGSASCVATMTQDYPHLFRNDPTWRARADKIGQRVRDFTTFLTDIADLAAGSLANGTRLPVTYHDSCQGLNALGLRAEPRRVLREILGCDIRELEESTLCCGFGGSFSFEYPEVARRLMNRKLNDAERTQAPLLVTDNQGCILHLRGGCDAANRPLKVQHLAELVADRIRALGMESRSNE